MKDEALHIVRDILDPAQKLNVLREYVQAMVLRSLHESEAFTALAFVGGTALRFIYDLPRFSEDIDFSLEANDRYQPEAWMKKIKNDLNLSGFHVTVNWNDQTTVHKAWIKVNSLLREAGLAAFPEQNLSIKLEIDTRPPTGASSVTGIINRYALLSLRYYDLPSLMAGKVHALIARKYTKGRDWYDLVWYRAKRPPTEPNTEQLQNALDQTQGEGVFVARNWKEEVRRRAQLLDHQSVVSDVAAFLERPADSALLTPDNICSLLNDSPSVEKPHHDKEG